MKSYESTTNSGMPIYTVLPELMNYLSTRFHENCNRSLFRGFRAVHGRERPPSPVVDESLRPIPMSVTRALRLCTSERQLAGSWWDLVVRREALAREEQRRVAVHVRDLWRCGAWGIVTTVHSGGSCLESVQLTWGILGNRCK